LFCFINQSINLILFLIFLLFSYFLFWCFRVHQTNAETENALPRFQKLRQALLPNRHSVCANQGLRK
jgi:hypothetical protein